MDQRGLTKIKYAMHNTHHIKTLNTTLFTVRRKRRQRQYTQPTNPSKCPEKSENKMHEHHKKWKVAGKMMRHARRSRRGRRKSMVQCSNNRRSKTTLTLATKEATMTQRCKTSKSHHNKNVADSRNRTHHSIVVATEQTSNTIGREETTAK